MLSQNVFFLNGYPFNCHFLLTLSSLGFLVPFSFSLSKFGLFRKPSTILSFLISIASVLMHISETKHALKPAEPLIVYSKWFLNFDRIIAYSSFLYFLKGFYPVMFKMENLDINIIFFISCIASFFGEQTTNLSYYTFSHLIWHTGCQYVLSRMTLLLK